MIDKRIKEELLKAKDLNSFNNICIKEHVDFFQDLDENIWKYYETLGSGGCSLNHEDPREAFK